MLLRHASGYFISTVIQLLSSVLLLALLTRFLSPGDYGRYALGMTVLQIVGGPLFHWIRAIVGRFLVNADLSGRRNHLIATARNAMLGCALAAVVLTIGIKYSGLVQGGSAPLLWAIVTAMIAQAFFQIETDIHRAELRLERCAALLIIQSVAGVGLALLFVIVFHLGAAGALYGITVSCLICLIGDARHSPLLARGPRLAWQDLRGMLAYALPLTGIMGLEMVLQSGDRFIIAGLLSNDAVAAYAAPQILASRAIQNLCIVVASSSLPLIIATYEREGAAAARVRYAQAGELMMVALIPVTVTLIVLARPITDLLIGPALRDQARQILPLVAVATVFNGLASHYLAHGFQIARRTALEIWAILPAAALGIVMDFALIPHYGVMAAGYALLSAQIVYAVLSWLLVRPLFDVPVPAWVSARILLPSLAAGGLIALLHLPSSIAGLVVGVAIMALFAGGGVLFSNVAGIRHALLQRWKSA
jgi:O-antigen/teichoic acid export membrane protein